MRFLNSSQSQSFLDTLKVQKESNEFSGVFFFFVSDISFGRFSWSCDRDVYLILQESLKDVEATGAPITDVPSEIQPENELIQLDEMHHV